MSGAGTAGGGAGAAGAEAAEAPAPAASLPAPQQTTLKVRVLQYECRPLPAKARTYAPQIFRNLSVRSTFSHFLHDGRAVYEGGEAAVGEADDPFVMDPSAMYGGNSLFYNNFNMPNYGAVSETAVRDYVRSQV